MTSRAQNWANWLRFRLHDEWCQREQHCGWSLLIAKSEPRNIKACCKRMRNYVFFKKVTDHSDVCLCRWQPQCRFATGCTQLPRAQNASLPFQVFQNEATTSIAGIERSSGIVAMRQMLYTSWSRINFPWILSAHEIVRAMSQWGNNS